MVLVFTTTDVASSPDDEKGLPAAEGEEEVVDRLGRKEEMNRGDIVQDPRK